MILHLLSVFKRYETRNICMNRVWMKIEHETKDLLHEESGLCVIRLAFEFVRRE